ncbi:protein ALTERED PHOSPHATE STARVATION RESPONSE 1-like [Cornus florida]|uniref:protein ALTERED PHOSPHATE STARVATION RESPONSE 1-like n=1 Tax=Cornus florida TaxID=4283 RepID=UPI0028A02D54|nr:protein ALTERED PHOSPHATE STARVATION RESPONSE 1-like [Cornus florida]XP_059636942.1 protein ALTERED PHOSPHATE STARVATION RESPONSE 1-like [Cornus florida]XP_059636943.1 protein ALTERED PHOSPHATE STARVATION RESPONSE 1-like [Cornus florida]XP_059636944.1 protein ALTERED PHOSPHATE STARVATION RESPONSE 1-like [Cornus florida]
MGCSTSKLDDEEAVQLCKDRKKFIKQAVEYRMRFASGHIAYIQSLKRISAALRDYVEGDEPREFLLDSYTTTPPFTPIKKMSSDFISISPNSFSLKPIQSKHNSSFKINYLRSGGNQSVAVEERPQSPETVRIETYSPMQHYGIDGFFAMQSSPMNSSSFFSFSPNQRPNFPPPSPQNSQWDFFWNPFSSLDYYGYPTRSSLDQTVLDDEYTRLRQVREEEGIPELEEETEQEETNKKVNMTKENIYNNVSSAEEEVFVEDVDEDDDDDDDDCETDSGNETKNEEKGLQSQGRQNTEVSKAQNGGQVTNQETAVADQKCNEGTPGFTVYVKRRPTCMAEVIKDLEDQFMIVCDSASEISAILEASRAQYSSTSNELTAMKVLNPVALFRSASSRSSSSRFLINSTSSRDEGDESTSDFSEESTMFLGNHQSTLDRLFAWEKKLYEEVRSGERIRIAYEKKCMQLRNQDVKRDDTSSVDKTRAAIRDLHTQIKVSIHSVESISKRIETLRDEELQPQLLELIQGLARMWKVMAECHQSQKRTLDEAKLLLAGTPSKKGNAKKHTMSSPSEPHRLASSAANLETELRNWRACFESWITSQRFYMHALASWLLRCLRSDSDTSKLPFSPRRSVGTPPIFGLCIQWSKFLDAIHEDPVLDGLDFFANGVGSLYSQQLKEDSRQTPVGSKRFGGGFLAESGGKMDMMEIGQLEEDVMTVEKMAEFAVRVLCAGMSVAVSSLTEFAVGSAEGYANLVKK